MGIFAGAVPAGPFYTSTKVDVPVPYYPGDATPPNPPYTNTAVPAVGDDVSIPPDSLTVQIPTAHLHTGMVVAGSGVATGTTVVTIVDANSLVLSYPATGAGIPAKATLSFTFNETTTGASASGTSIAAPTANLAVGMKVFGNDIPANATIASITDGANFVLSAAVTGGGVASGAALAFTAVAVTTASTAAPTAWYVSNATGPQPEAVGQYAVNQPPYLSAVQKFDALEGYGVGATINPNRLVEINGLPPVNTADIGDTPKAPAYTATTPNT